MFQTLPSTRSALNRSLLLWWWWWWWWVYLLATWPYPKWGLSHYATPYTWPTKRGWKICHRSSRDYSYTCHSPWCSPWEHLLTPYHQFLPSLGMAGSPKEKRTWVCILKVKNSTNKTHSICHVLLLFWVNTMISFLFKCIFFPIYILLNCVYCYWSSLLSKFVFKTLFKQLKFACKKRPPSTGGS